MNTDIPNIELPTPPEGHRWEYRGEAWKNTNVTRVVVLTDSGKLLENTGTCYGLPDYRYWEAIAVPPAQRIEKLEAEIRDLKESVEFYKDALQRAELSLYGIRQLLIR